MICRIDLIEEAAATVGGRGSHPDDKRRLGRWLNKILVSLSERHSFELLRRKMTIDLADSSTTVGQEGVWLPANLAGIDALQDVATGKYYRRRDADAIGNVEAAMPRYSAFAPGLQPLFWADDLRIDKGSKTFTSNRLDDDDSEYAGDYTDEWIRLGNEPNFYQLTDEREIAETYWGETLINSDVTIRPTTQKKLVVHDDHDTILQSGEVTLYYWIYHPLMYRDSDPLLFPYPRLVDLMMQKEAKGSLSRRSRDPLNVEIEDAWRETVRLNPVFQIPANSVDRIGNNFDPAQMQYIRRGTTSNYRSMNVSDWR